MSLELHAARGDLELGPGTAVVRDVTEKNALWSISERLGLSSAPRSLEARL